MDELYPDLEGRRDVELFSTAKLLGRKTCLVHGLHLRDDEVQQMAAAGASVASCPYTAMLYFDGLAPLPRWSALGLTIGLGTDVAAGYCPSMTGVGRLATLADRAAQWAAPHDAGRIDWIFAFHLATAGGAATLVLDDKIGRFEVGMQFDALLVDVDVQGQVFDYMKGDAIQEHIERWWNTGDDRNLRKVWVQGRSILEGLAV
jgi:guanine deaminase